MVNTNKFDLEVWSKLTKLDLTKWITNRVTYKSIHINKLIQGTYIGKLCLGFQYAFYTTKNGRIGEVRNLSKKVILGIVKEILCQ